MIAEKLGAINVPRSRIALDAYLLRMQPQLLCDQRTLATLEMVLHAPAPNAVALPWVRLMMHAGIELLPDWAKHKLDVTVSGVVQRTLLRYAVATAAVPVRWAVRNGSVHLARRRMATPA